MADVMPLPLPLVTRVSIVARPHKVARAECHFRSGFPSNA